MRGGIDPVAARYLERDIRRGEADRAEVVIVQLDTPGGLESSTREIVQTVLVSSVPLVVYVAPSGARAASAGMFVTLAAGVAAMAPATEIGAAHPVRLGPGKSDSAVEAKVVHDTAAFARTLAETRKRNADWSERAVREGVSLTSDAALREGVVDAIAVDVPDLLKQLLDGRTVATVSGERTLHTAGLRIDERPMHLSERIVRVLSDSERRLPALVGLLGVTAELYHPGTFIPGPFGHRAPPRVRRVRQSSDQLGRASCSSCSP